MATPQQAAINVTTNLAELILQFLGLKSLGM
jgi:hypothetical protein